MRPALIRNQTSRRQQHDGTGLRDRICIFADWWRAGVPVIQDDIQIIQADVAVGSTGWAGDVRALISRGYALIPVCKDDVQIVQADEAVTVQVPA